MKYSVDKKASTAILHIGEERLDSRFTSELKAQLLLLLNEQELSTILVDLKQTTYADSSGLGALLLGLRQARDTGKNFALVGAQKRVISLIKIAHLDELMVNYSSVATALKALA